MYKAGAMATPMTFPCLLKLHLISYEPSPAPQYLPRMHLNTVEADQARYAEFDPGKEKSHRMVKDPAAIACGR